MSADRRKRSNVRQYSAEDQALTNISKEAESRLAAKRAAREEAKAIRSKEIERRQQEAEEKERLGNDNSEGLTRSRQQTTVSSRRGSDESNEGVGEVLVTKERDLKMELRSLEEKYKAAMMSSAQLDNEKQSLVYQVELLKDQLEEQAEGHTELQREYKDKNRELEMKKRELQAALQELKSLREMNDYKDRLITESGLVIVAAENGELALERSGEAPPSNGPIGTSGVLLSSESLDLLNKSGNGSLGTHIIPSSFPASSTVCSVPDAMPSSPNHTGSTESDSVDGVKPETNDLDSVHFERQNNNPSVDEGSSVDGPLCVSSSVIGSNEEDGKGLHASVLSDSSCSLDEEAQAAVENENAESYSQEGENRKECVGMLTSMHGDDNPSCPDKTWDETGKVDSIDSKDSVNDEKSAVQPVIPSVVITACNHSQSVSSQNSEEDGDEFFDAISTPIPSPVNLSKEEESHFDINDQAQNVLRVGATGGEPSTETLDMKVVQREGVMGVSYQDLQPERVPGGRCPDSGEGSSVDPALQEGTGTAQAVGPADDSVVSQTCHYGMENDGLLKPDAAAVNTALGFDGPVGEGDKEMDVYVEPERNVDESMENSDSVHESVQETFDSFGDESQTKTHFAEIEEDILSIKKAVIDKDNESYLPGELPKVKASSEIRFGDNFEKPEEQENFELKSMDVLRYDSILDVSTGVHSVEVEPSQDESGSEVVEVESTQEKVMPHQENPVPKDVAAVQGQDLSAPEVKSAAGVMAGNEKSEPVVEGDKAVTDEGEPAVEGDKAITDVDEPVVEGDKAITDEGEPAVERDKAITDVDEPAVERDKAVNDEGDKAVTDEGEHAVEGDKAVTDVNEPAVEGDKAVTDVDEPVVEGDKAVTDVDEPAVEGDKAVTNVDEPAVEGDKAVSDVDEPVVEGDKAVTDVDEPAVEGDKAVTDVDEPAVEGDKAVTDEDEPVVEGDKAVTDVDEPAVEGDKAVTDKEPVVEGDKAVTDEDEPAVEGDKAVTDEGEPAVEGDKAVTDEEPVVEGDKAVTDPVKPSQEEVHVQKEISTSPDKVVLKEESTDTLLNESSQKAVMTPQEKVKPALNEVEPEEEVYGGSHEDNMVAEQTVVPVKEMTEQKGDTLEQGEAPPDSTPVQEEVLLEEGNTSSEQRDHAENVVIAKGEVSPTVENKSLEEEDKIEPEKSDVPAVLDRVLSDSGASDTSEAALCDDGYNFDDIDEALADSSPAKVTKDESVTDLAKANLDAVSFGSRDYLVREGAVSDETEGTKEDSTRSGEVDAVVGEDSFSAEAAGGQAVLRPADSRAIAASRESLDLEAKLDTWVSQEGSDDKVKAIAGEKKRLIEEVKRLENLLDEQSKQKKDYPQLPQVNGPEMQLYEVQREASKQIHEYKFKLQKAEQDIATLEGMVNRLETQVKRYKSDAERAESVEDELKQEKRKLLRELREAQTQVEELQNQNKHLTIRLDRIKQSRTALGIQ